MFRSWVRALAALCATGGLVAFAQDAAPPTTQPLSQRDVLFVHQFRFEGNTVFTDAQLDALLQRYVGREITIDELEEARRAVTLHYVQQGYINSGAVIPDQEVADGVVTIRIVEGRLSDIEISGRDEKNQKTAIRLREQYLRDRLHAGAGRVLNVFTLRDRLELIRQNPNVRQINAELKPGDMPGAGRLEVLLAENNPYHLALEFSNKRSPSIGAERFDVLAGHRNLTGHSDPLGVRYGLTRGGLDSMELSGADDFSVDYSRPLTASDMTLILSFTRSDSLVVEEPFDALDITSETNSGSITLRQPIYRTPASEFAVSASVGVRDNKTFLLGEPFSFSPGAENGKSRVAALRLGQEYFTRNQTRAIALRSTFSFGLDAFGSTIHGDDDTADSQFFAWLGQFQYVRRLFQSENQLIFRTSLQLASDPLLSLEQFSVGGIDTVRGYRENQIVRDNGLVTSLELRIPMLQRAGRSVLELAPFIDAGWGWSVEDEPESESLCSVGLGVLFHPNRSVNLAIYYGYALRDFDSRDDLQDIGIHFDLIISAF